MFLSNQTKASGLALEMGEAAAPITQQRPLIARYAWPVGGPNRATMWTIEFRVGAATKLTR